ncbi:hemerythrin domain-containing protein, partial [Streptomyces sp. NPDC059873]|uniref:hemerythrin domain-containing protein n=1 Tax=Streptomyces sp. NPDC059873 TaxID=3346982 RepID=UPI00365C7548
PRPLQIELAREEIAYGDVHHTSEDAHAFPALAAQHPHLREAIDRLGEEHRVLARVKDALLALLADITTADPERFRAELARLSAELVAHLDYEEEELLPALSEIRWPPVPPQGPEPAGGGAG